MESTLSRRRLSQACVRASTLASNSACVANHRLALWATISPKGLLNGNSVPDFACFLCCIRTSQTYAWGAANLWSADTRAGRGHCAPTPAFRNIELACGFIRGLLPGLVGLRGGLVAGLRRIGLPAGFLTGGLTGVTGPI